MNEKIFNIKSAQFDTPLGVMIALADEQALFLLEFADRRALPTELKRLKQKTRASIEPGITEPIRSIQDELTRYFAGTLRTFNTPYCFLGSPFQKGVWDNLTKIPFGETRSYAELAEKLGKPAAFRAVANANGANQLALIIPCHRVIHADGTLSGYGGGVHRKQWLIDHEKRFGSIL